MGYASGYTWGTHGTPWHTMGHHRTSADIGAPSTGQEMTDRAAPLVQVCLDYGLTGVLPLNDVFWPNVC